MTVGRTWTERNGMTNTQSQMPFNSTWVRLLFSVSNCFVMIPFCNWWSQQPLLVGHGFALCRRYLAADAVDTIFTSFGRANYMPAFGIDSVFDSSLVHMNINLRHVHATIITTKQWCGTKRVENFLSGACVCALIIARFKCLNLRKIALEFHIRDQLQCVRCFAAPTKTYIHAWQLPYSKYADHKSKKQQIVSHFRHSNKLHSSEIVRFRMQLRILQINK